MHRLFVFMDRWRISLRLLFSMQFLNRFLGGPLRRFTLDYSEIFKQISLDLLKARMHYSSVLTGSVLQFSWLTVTLWRTEESNMPTRQAKLS